MPEHLKGCFAIGCGPSLNAIDVRQLAPYDTITFNRAFLAFDQWGFVPDYYACLDPIVLEDNLAEIEALIEQGAVRRFFLHKSAAQLLATASTRVELIELEEQPTFRTTLPLIGDFGNVGATSLQILAALGYRKIALVGVDGRYGIQPVDSDGETIVATSDEDHFRSDYLCGKRRLARPDMIKILGRWEAAAQGCAETGLQVCNASPGSALTCFPHLGIAEALAWISPKTPAGEV